MPVEASDDSPCAVELVGELVFGKWTSHLLWALEHRGPLRFSELAAGAPRATAKVVTARLRQLERDGLVTRRRFGGVPPGTEYAITELGQSLIPAFRRLADWSEARRADVAQARARFDARSIGHRMPPRWSPDETALDDREEPSHPSQPTNRSSTRPAR